MGQHDLVKPSCSDFGARPNRLMKGNFAVAEVRRCTVRDTHERPSEPRHGGRDGALACADRRRGICVHGLITDNRDDCKTSAFPRNTSEHVDESAVRKYFPPATAQKAVAAPNFRSSARLPLP